MHPINVTGFSNVALGHPMGQIPLPFQYTRPQLYKTQGKPCSRQHLNAVVPSIRCHRVDGGLIHGTGRAALFDRLGNPSFSSVSRTTATTNARRDTALREE
ncbi:hypothetical protein BsWGS_16965 [Bradybaena similaris]